MIVVGWPSHATFVWEMKEMLRRQEEEERWCDGVWYILCDDEYVAWLHIIHNMNVCGCSETDDFPPLHSKCWKFSKHSLFDLWKNEEASSDGNTFHIYHKMCVLQAGTTAITSSLVVVEQHAMIAQKWVMALYGNEGSEARVGRGWMMMWWGVVCVITWWMWKLLKQSAWCEVMRCVRDRQELVMCCILLWESGTLTFLCVTWWGVMMMWWCYTHMYHV